MRVTAVITHEAPWYVARCVEIYVASQGTTSDEALANLEDAVALYASMAHPSLTDERPVIATIELSA
jgi:predicted RNase H-like HicB family nuclease